MEQRHRTQVYPPRVKMTVAPRDHALIVYSILPVKFLGSNDLLETELMISLGMIHVLCIKFFSQVILAYLITAPSIIYRTTTGSDV